MTINADINIKGNLRKFYTKLDDEQDLTYTKSEWQALRDLYVKSAQWTDTQLDRALLKDDKYLGLSDGYNCYVS